MNIRYTVKAKKWFKRYRVDTDKLTEIIERLCKKEGKCKRKLSMLIHIMPRARDSDFMFYGNKLSVAVGSSASKPRHYKLKKVVTNLLHELRHFIQYRVQNKPFTFSYTKRDANLVSDRYWNDPDEIDARNYERKLFSYVYKKII